jgi:hypothetical protein
MSEIRATTISNAAGTGPITMTGQYAAKAWVNFNGTGTVAIRDGGNVGSITDNGTGDYTVNFTTAIVDANYSLACSAVGSVGYQVQFTATPKANTSFSTTSVGIVTGNTSSAAYTDSATVSATITR